MKNWNQVKLVPEFNEQGVACYKLAGGNYVNEYYVVSEAETRKLLNTPEIVGYEVYDCLIPSTSQMLYYFKESKESDNCKYSFYLERSVELSVGGKLLQRAHPCTRYQFLIQ